MSRSAPSILEPPPLQEENATSEAVRGPGVALDASRTELQMLRGHQAAHFHVGSSFVPPAQLLVYSVGLVSTPGHMSSNLRLISFHLIVLAVCQAVAVDGAPLLLSVSTHCLSRWCSSGDGPSRSLCLLRVIRSPSHQPIRVAFLGSTSSPSSSSWTGPQLP